MRLHHANAIIFLGLFFHILTLHQGPTCVLAVTRKPANPWLEKFPQFPQGRRLLLGLPILPPIREQPYDPLYNKQGDMEGRPRLLKTPRLPTIPEEGDTPRGLTAWAVQFRTRVLAGRGGPPITGFAYHRNRAVGAPNVRHLPPLNRGRG
ncbi:hypothetical protein MTO96_040183 [Rhipicephalus appendiculatus]|uniref:Secreted protein n=1 Tax=Rhipicephalus appendiculatus TaxID=34631 RepID=A0A131YHE0_RHIAP